MSELENTNSATWWLSHCAGLSPIVRGGLISNDSLSKNHWWFEQHLELPSGIPSHDTLGRVFARIDTEEFEQGLLEYVRCLKLNLKGRTVAIDGKTLRGSHDHSSQQSCAHMVTAWADELRTVPGIMTTSDKSNEIPAVQQLLEVMQLKGAVVTADAMHCQKETAALIIK